MQAIGSGASGGAYITALRDAWAMVQLTRTFVLPAAAYAGPSPLLPGADRWLLAELLGEEDAQRMPVAALEFVGERNAYLRVLTGLTNCMERMRPKQLIATGDTLTAVPSAYGAVQKLRAYVQSKAGEEAAAAEAAAAAAAAVNSSVYRAFGPAGMPQTPNCSLLSTPNPRGIPREHEPYDAADYLPVRPDQDIYQLLSAGAASSSTFDVMGVVSELHIPRGRTLSLGRMVLVNLAPGGYAYDWGNASMAAVAGWAEAQGPLAAGFANQSLPIWWAQADR